MLDVQLIINSTNGEQTVELNEGTLTFGRTELSDFVLPDNSLSRRHATFERRDDEIWIYDENSTNGTFLNNSAISARGAKVSDADEIRLGDNTIIFVQIRRSANVSQSNSAAKTEPKPNKTAAPKPKEQGTKNNEQRTLLIVIAALTFFIVALAAFGFLFVVPRLENSSRNKNKPTPQPSRTDIGTGIVDLPKDDFQADELLDLWEVQEEQLAVADVRDVRSANQKDLNVSQAFWLEQRNRARAARSGNLNVGDAQPPAELATRGLAPQFKKMDELNLSDRLPRDFTDISRMRLSGELTEMPLATKDFVLDQIGTSANGDDFTIFNPDTFERDSARSSSTAFANLTKLAADFAGQKYNLSEAADRLEFKRRLLRSVRPPTKRFIEELAGGYRQKFNYPLLVTSLIRSLEYQYLLRQVNPNATRAKNPPHASGCTFDIAFSQMSAAELNYIYEKLAEYERAGKIDALFEAKNCIHIFVYPDGKPAR